MTFGAIEAIRAAGKTTGTGGDITLISFDGTRSALEKVKSGVINVDIECNPLQGTYIQEIINRLEDGESVDKINYVEEKVYTQKMCFLFWETECIKGDKTNVKSILVEDETVIREGLRDRIPWEQYGYRFVGEAADGEVALPLIRKTRPDVLITDIKMPFMDGLSLSRIVREEFPKTKILIISGYDDFEYAREAISIGVDQYILKPVTRMSLRKVLQELKEKSRQSRSRKIFRANWQTKCTNMSSFP